MNIFWQLITEKLSVRDAGCVETIFSSLKNLFSCGEIGRKFTSIIVIFEMLGALLFGYPTTPRGEAVDMSKFELVWADEFDGDALDTSKWEGHGFSFDSNTPHIRRGGYWAKDAAIVSDGSLRITTGYFENGLNNGPAGYYSCGIQTKYTQTFGYFECRCILPEGHDIWSAFWLYCRGVTGVNGDGKDGTEIDIYESLYYSDKKNNCVSSNLHFDGYGEEHQSVNVGLYYVNNPYKEFNTYGLEWNENEYIFYINGIEAGRSNFGGVSQVPEFMIISTEVAGADGVPSENILNHEKENDTHMPSDFIVDYVRAYQYK